MTAAELSRILFAPVTVTLYGLAMVAYLYGMAAGVDRSGEGGRPGRRALAAGTVLAALGAATHTAHVITRSIAAGGRMPWGNMFEYSSLMALGVVVAGLVVVQWRMRRPELVGFLLIGALLVMGSAVLVWSEPGPLAPVLESQWLKIHVFAVMTAATVFTFGFIVNGLFLLRDTAERRVAEQRTAALKGSTVGAAYDTEVADPLSGSVPERVPAAVAAPDDDAAYGEALRRAIHPLKLALGVWLGAATISWTFWVSDGPARMLAVNTALAAAALVAWRFLHRLPPAATLESLTYRTIAFGFPLWTFAVIAGAIWAEQAWGRFWGWDPKETSAFLTWIAYAGYLHARATRGWQGRRAAWLGIVAFWVLMFTYFTVNLVVVGLHSYAGVS